MKNIPYKTIDLSLKDIKAYFHPTISIHEKAIVAGLSGNDYIGTDFGHIESTTNAECRRNTFLMKYNKEMLTFKRSEVLGEMYYHSHRNTFYHDMKDYQVLIATTDTIIYPKYSSSYFSNIVSDTSGISTKVGMSVSKGSRFIIVKNLSNNCLFFDVGSKRWYRIPYLELIDNIN